MGSSGPGDARSDASTVRNPNGLGTTTNIYSGSCADNATICLGFGVSCLNITSGQPTSRQVPVPQTRVDWQVIGSNNSAGCALSASSTSTGQDGIAAVQVTSAVGGECLIEARTGSGPSSTAVTALVESRIDQSRVDFLECQGVTPVTGLAYEVAQAALTLDTAFVVADANLVPVQGARLQVIVVDPTHPDDFFANRRHLGCRRAHVLFLGRRQSSGRRAGARDAGGDDAGRGIPRSHPPVPLARAAGGHDPALDGRSAGELVRNPGVSAPRSWTGPVTPTVSRGRRSTSRSLRFSRPSRSRARRSSTSSPTPTVSPAHPTATLSLAKPTDPFDFTVTALAAPTRHSPSTTVSLASP